MPMKNSSKIFLLCLLVLVSGGLDAALAESSRSLLFAGNKMWIHVRKAPLQNILRQFSDENIGIQIDPSINPAITLSLSAVDIQKGLSLILKNQNYILEWEVMKGALGPVEKLAMIKVFHPGGQKFLRPLKNASGFNIAKDKSGRFYVKDELLLGFKKGIDPDRVMKILESLGGRILQLDRRSGIYRLKFPEDSDLSALIEKLKNSGIIEAAEPNWAYKMGDPHSGKLLGNYSSDGSGATASEGAATVAVLDSGLSPAAGLEGLVVSSLDAVDPDGFISDSLGHGSQMALVASGKILPQGADKSFSMENPIIPIRTFDDNGFTSNFTIIQALDYAVENNARVINLSWGSETKSEFLESAFANARNSGCYLVAAAGNEPTGEAVYPAAYDSVIGVGALAPIGTTWEKSNYGSHVIMMAPGFADMPIGYGGDPGTYAGTSISSAFISGVIADIISKNPGIDQKGIMEKISSAY